MLFVDFARWVLLAFGLLVALVLVILVMQIGWLGEGPQTSISELIGKLQAAYAQHKKRIDAAGWLLGIAGSAATAALTVHRSWYYAERNLPQRLIDRLRRDIGDHLNARPALIAAINDPIPPARLFAPVVYRGYFDWLLKSSGAGPLQRSADKLATSVDLLKDEIAIVDGHKEKLATRLVTARLLRGAHIAGRAAAETEPNSAERRQLNDHALQEFLAALEVDESDLDALELAAKQHRMVGDIEPALTLLHRMARTAGAKDDFLRQARALRLQAEMLEKSSDEQDWDRARAALKSAIDEVLPKLQRDGIEKSLELAKACRLLGEVQMTREKFYASRTALNRAHTLFTQMVPKGIDGLASTEDALRRLDIAQKDKEGSSVE